jgi:hypothetical protein
VNTPHDFNNINKNLKFRMESELDNKIHFLDITINRGKSKFEHNIFRKPTVTSATIHNTHMNTK